MSGTNRETRYGFWRNILEEHCQTIRQRTKPGMRRGTPQLTSPIRSEPVMKEASSAVALVAMMFAFCLSGLRYCNLRLQPRKRMRAQSYKRFAGPLATRWSAPPCHRAVAQWEDVISKMISVGAKRTDEEFATVLTYHGDQLWTQYQRYKPTVRPAIPSAYWVRVQTINISSTSRPPTVGAQFGRRNVLTATARQPAAPTKAPIWCVRT